MACAGNADDHALPPTLVATLQRGSHYVDVADAFEAVVHASVREIDDDVLDRGVVVIRIDQIGCAHLSRKLELGRVDVDADDPRRASLLCAEDACESNTSKAKDGHGVSRLHLRSVVDRANASGHATSEQADLLKRGFR